VSLIVHVRPGGMTTLALHRTYMAVIGFAPLTAGDEGLVQWLTLHCTSIHAPTNCRTIATLPRRLRSVAPKVPVRENWN
jgi:hypothetical protein